MHRTRYNWLDKQAAVRNYHRQLQEDNDVTQITVTNHTDDKRKVCLWGAISCVPLTDPMFLEDEVTKTVIVDKHPQELAYNPANDCFYVVNQLGNSVSVISSKGQLKQTIVLGTTALPGAIGPVALAVNTKADGSEYGMVAVACSVSDEVVFIDAANTIVRRVPVGTRPVDIVHNPVDDCYYVANLVSGSLSKLGGDGSASNLPPIEGARTIGVNLRNGDLYVHGLKDGSIDVYGLSGNLKGSVGSVASRIVSFAFHPFNKTMYVGLNDSNVVSVVDPVSFHAIRKVNVGGNPVSLAYNPHDGLMYVGNRDDQRFTRIDANHQVVDAIATGSFGMGLAISTKEDLVAVSNFDDDTVTISGIKGGPTVTVNEEYHEHREDFQHNPTLVSHLKIVASGEEGINAMQLIEKSVTGKQTCQTLSLGDHRSPQSFSNVLEVFDVEGELIDGHSIWCFKINPRQVVTFLIYHKQFEMYGMLPDKSRLSTGVQMSEGIPASWAEHNERKSKS